MPNRATGNFRSRVFQGLRRRVPWEVPGSEMMAETDGEGLVRVDLEGDSGCARCPSHEVCQAVSREDGAAGGFRGWAFAGAAVGYFLFPLILAGVGAAAGGSQVGQLIGAAAGLGLGMAVAAAVVNRRRASEETAWLRR